MMRPFICPVGFMMFPIIFLLSLSFFILVVLANVKTQTLKTFGYVIVALIWLTTVAVFGGGMYKMSKFMRPGMHCKKNAMLKYPGMNIVPQADSSEVMICPKPKDK